MGVYELDEVDRDTPHLPASDVVLRSALASLRATLSGEPDAAHTRMLVASVESYLRILDRWRAIPPTTDQRLAMTDLVDSLREEVEALAPPRSRVRLARLVLKPITQR